MINYRGSLPLLLLHLLSEAPSYGYRIAQEIKHRSSGVLDFKEGTLYPALHQLEREGLLESFTVEEGGRPRRYYRLTEAGAAALTEQRAAWEQFMGAVTAILRGTTS